MCLSCVCVELRRDFESGLITNYPTFGHVVHINLAHLHDSSSLKKRKKNRNIFFL